MIFCAKFYFSAQMATMAIGNANPEFYSNWQKTKQTTIVLIGALRVKGEGPLNAMYAL